MNRDEPPGVPLPREPDQTRATYAVELRPAVRRALRKLDKPIARRLVVALTALGSDPRPAGVKALSGTERPMLRVRVGDYRIVYEVHDSRLVVLVVFVGHRRDIYRQIQ